MHVKFLRSIAGLAGAAQYFLIMFRSSLSHNELVPASRCLSLLCQISPTGHLQASPVL